MEYRIVGNIFEDGQTTMELKVGDFMIYDKIDTNQNGEFKTLGEFKM